MSSLTKDLEGVFNRLNDKVKSTTSNTIEYWVMEWVSFLTYALTILIGLTLIIGTGFFIITIIMISYIIDLAFKGFKKIWQNK
tara:strand:+ start:2087 stop:2335 length:249 start_codon:yes stop_codon:yes gene_type:complete